MTISSRVKSVQQFLLHNFYNVLLVLAVVVLLVGVPLSQAQAAKDTKPVAEVTVNKVNINKADAASLAQVLKGVGIKKAEAIVAYRKQNGKFKTADELAEVKGIGEATVAKNKSRIAL